MLVVGGGVTGAGVALDAASRGLRVALVERRDLAWGTSRWSLQARPRRPALPRPGRVRHRAWRARASATSCSRAPRRTSSARSARPIPLTPQVERQGRARSARRPGPRRRPAPRRRHLGARAARARAAPTPTSSCASRPASAATACAAALISHDAQLEDDARLVVGLARTARRARRASRHPLRRAAAHRRRRAPARRADRRDLRRPRPRRRQRHRRLGRRADRRPAPAPQPRHAPRRRRWTRLGGLAGQLSVPVPGERNRWVFAIAQRTGVAYVGLTDEAAPGPIPDVPERARGRHRLPAGHAQRDARAPADARRRPRRPTPACARSSRATTTRVRRPLAPATRSSGAGGGLVSVVGGKLTTYRQMAQDAVDAAIDAGGLATRGPCRTHDLPLSAPRRATRWPPSPRRARLVDRHGTEAPAVLALRRRRPRSCSRRSLPGLDVLGVEVLHAAARRGRPGRRRRPGPPHPHRAGRSRSRSVRVQPSRRCWRKVVKLPRRERRHDRRHPRRDPRLHPRLRDPAHDADRRRAPRRREPDDGLPPLSRTSTPSCAT